MRSFLDELDTLLSSFPEDGTPLILLGDFNIHLEASHSAAFLPLLHSFNLSLQSSPPTHKAGNLLDLVFVRYGSPSKPTVTPLHMSDHYFISFSIPLAPLPPPSPPTRTVTVRRNIHSHPPLLPLSLLLSLFLNPSLIYPLILLLLLYFPLSPLHLTLSVLLFLGLLGLPLPVHGSPTPCVPPEPAYVQLRGSGGNPGTHQTFLHINLFW